MERDKAQNLLELHGGFDVSEINAAYIQKVKSAKNNGTIDNDLRDLNCARDALLQMHNEGKELVPFLQQQLISIEKERKLTEVRRQAREEFESSISALEKKLVKTVRRKRNSTGFLAAASAVMAFGRENLSELSPQLAEAPRVGLFLLAGATTLGFMSYMQNRYAEMTAEVVQDAKRQMMRTRAVERILGQIFAKAETVSEQEFIKSVTKYFDFGMPRRRLDPFSRLLEVYSSLGIPLIKPRFYLDRDTLDDYIDFLVKSGQLRISNTPDGELRFHKTNDLSS